MDQRHCDRSTGQALQTRLLAFFQERAPHFLKEVPRLAKRFEGHEDQLWPLLNHSFPVPSQTLVVSGGCQQYVRGWRSTHGNSPGRKAAKLAHPATTVSEMPMIPSDTNTRPSLVVCAAPKENVVSKHGSAAPPEIMSPFTPGASKWLQQALLASPEQPEKERPPQPSGYRLFSGSGSQLELKLTPKSSLSSMSSKNSYHNMDMDDIAMQFMDNDINGGTNDGSASPPPPPPALVAQHFSQSMSVGSRKLSGLSHTSSCLSLLNERRSSLMSVGSNFTDFDIDQLLSGLQSPPIKVSVARV